jgi:hypothetical protein
MPRFCQYCRSGAKGKKRARLDGSMAAFFNGINRNHNEKGQGHDEQKRHKISPERFQS